MKKYTYSDFCYAVNLWDQDRYSDALSILKGFIDELQTQGKESPYAYYVFAICKDMVGESFDALVAINRALDLDPYAPYFHNSKGIIMRKVIENLRELIATGKTKQAKDVYGIMLELGDVTPLAQELMMEVAYQEADQDFQNYLRENILKVNPNYKFKTAV